MASETQLLQGLWMKAYTEGEVRLKLSSKSDATRLRFKLYAAVAKVRKGEEVNPDLKEAVDNCLVSVVDAELVVRGSMQTEVMQMIKGVLGDAELPEVLTPEQAEVQASMKRVGELLDGTAALKESVVAEAGGGQTRATPYYTREG